MVVSENESRRVIKHILKDTLTEYPETIEMLEFYDQLSLEKMSYDRIFEEICWIVYASGFRFDIVKKYWPSIRKEYHNFNVTMVAPFSQDLETHAQRICRNSGFNNVKKAKWCIQNAQRLIELDSEKRRLGGLKNFFIEISKKNPLELVELAPRLVKELRLKGIGNTTIFHLMKNLGMNLFKPDIHIRRFLTNIGLIDNEKAAIQDIYNAMQYLSAETGMELWELDTVLFNFGRINGDVFNIERF